MKIVREKLAILAILIALSVVLALFFVIPVPLTKGYVNFLEVGIYIAAMLFGGPAGFIVGAISGGMLDLLLGYPQWLPFSVLIHGLQGYVAGRFTRNGSNSGRMISLISASLLMIVGYFFATWFLYGSVAGVTSIIGNVFQTGFGMVISLVLIKVLDRLNLTK